jgi:MFS family permease
VSFYIVMLVTVLNHISFKGSKVLITLYALDLGANPLTVGLLFSMYSLFPVFLSLYAGKMSDRYGFPKPMLIGSIGLMGGLLVPYLYPTLPALYVSALAIGLCYIFYIVSVQHLIGSFGTKETRTRYFSHYSLGIGLTALLGPAIAGFAIDGVGHQATYLLFAVFPALPILVIAVYPRVLPRLHGRKGERQEQQRTMDLVRIVPLRRALITAGILETGAELANFLLPIYGHTIGLSASEIGILMACYAAALLSVRIAMPWLVKRSSEERVLSLSMFLAAAVCIGFPFAHTYPGLLAMTFVIGLALGCGGPISLVLAYNRSPAGRTGEGVGLRQTVNKATEVVVPVIFGSVSAALGMLPVFWLDAVMLAYGGLLMRADADNKAPIPESSPDAAAQTGGREGGLK